MLCPHGGGEVGQNCSKNECWLWNKTLYGRCAAIAVGTTHLVERDIANIFGESMSSTKTRIEHGRQKMSAWLYLIQKAEEVPLDKPYKGPIGPIAEIAEKFFVLEDIMTMTPARWNAVADAMTHRLGAPAKDIRME